MRWGNQRESSHIEDRRGEFGGFGRSTGSYGRSGVRVPIPGGPKVKLALLVVVMVAGYYGVDLSGLLTGDIGSVANSVAQSANRTSSARGQYAESAEERELRKLVGLSLGSMEDVWHGIFKQNKMTYEEPSLVLYSGSTSTACGYGQSAMGPFYCPADNRVYLDLSFHRDMQKKYGGGGDFALGYVLAHEVGHHVQNLLGTEKYIRSKQMKASQKEQNRLSVQMELQADCYAGVWGHYMNKQGILEKGDLEKALRTATAIGDDRLQKQAGGRVVPDSFTHGTSEQRLRWFRVGFDTGNPGKCTSVSR